MSVPAVGRFTCLITDGDGAGAGEDRPHATCYLQSSMRVSRRAGTDTFTGVFRRSRSAEGSAFEAACRVRAPGREPAGNRRVRRACCRRCSPTCWCIMMRAGVSHLCTATPPAASPCCAVEAVPAVLSWKGTPAGCSASGRLGRVALPAVCLQAFGRSQCVIDDLCVTKECTQESR